jgi:hypothetical protein
MTSFPPTKAAMSKYHYRITLEQLDTAAPETASRALRFDFDNHDDIFAILERLQRRGDLSARETPQLVLGLKLMGKVLMENEGNPLLASLKPHFMEFMRELKKGAPKEAE